MSVAPEDAAAIEAAIEAASSTFRDVERALGDVVVGQRALTDGLLTALLADGHVLLEGLPGLAKSLAVQTLAVAVGGTFRRIQFTPDLLPSDLTGTQVYDPRTGVWSVREGPVFANVVLADEVNRAPAKVQSALLEAMQERQVSLAGETRRLPDPFLVLATQNPVELEGTYPLPEAQVDRFLLKIVVTYPTKEEEREVARRMSVSSGRPEPKAVTSPEKIVAARRLLDRVRVDEKVLTYVVDLVSATRDPVAAGLEDLRGLVLYGASPRASIALVRASRARAFLKGRDYVTPHDVKGVAPDALRHRVVTTYEAEAEGVTSAEIVRRVLDIVPVP